MNKILEEFYRTPRLFSWSGTTVEVKIDGVRSVFLGDDCTTMIGSWVQARWGEDPAADLRGTYSTAEEARAVVRSEGGLAALGDRRLELCGYSRTKSEPEDEDIGLVRGLLHLDCEIAEIPAVRFGPLWMVMSTRGAAVKKLEWTGVAWRRK